jgi:hypothetical protein
VPIGKKKPTSVKVVKETATEGEEKRPGPKWVVNDEDEELWGAALGHGAGRDVLKSRSATAGFVKSKCKLFHYLCFGMC